MQVQPHFLWRALITPQEWSPRAVRPNKIGNIKDGRDGRTTQESSTGHLIPPAGRRRIPSMSCTEYSQALPESHSLPDQPQCPRPRAPFRHEVRETPVLLAPARVQRRHLRMRRRIGQLQALQMREDCAAPARERVQEGALVARKLEPRDPSHKGRRDLKRSRYEPPMFP